MAQNENGDIDQGQGNPQAGPTQPTATQPESVEQYKNEIELLKAEIARLAAAALAAQANPTPQPTNGEFSMSATPEAIAQARALALVLKSETKKVSLPGIQKGHRGHPSMLVVPPKVEECIKNYSYIPYTALTTAAKLKTAQGDEDFVINSSGSITAKGLDRRNEQSIALADWLAAASLIESRIRHHHGNDYADMLANHHANVQGGDCCGSHNRH
ncbi:hypothetical protein SISSUDRAFT_1131707 [Sistotremastrum suecicum HHB10207 ss-3]|uniref:Uncharacterized protein n=1 Tax=Sistotremastrum suecicum HHB10207 ss-3 TaxID=1314776 RepID=A0A165ZVI1_9AGAM|nr:hypothetical protein SISSUDRAFT_1131707 [Sistotremastrum suecicum HHB10207 ss-3]